MGSMLEPGNYCVAVSGGVDSVVLLHRLVQAYPSASYRFIVAHFDHGVRSDSADDALFVAQLAQDYGLDFETTREELGKNVSEEYARRRRYEFLRRVAKKYKATIVTAHHADDVVETIAINIVRGTGWRGVAVMGSPDIVRPLTQVRKREILSYAKQHALSWHEDSTNATDKYLRNRLRNRLTQLDDDCFWQLLALRDQQLAIKKQIEDEALTIAGCAPYKRHLFIMSDSAAAEEMLRAACIAAGYSPLASQLQRAILAIKTAKAGTKQDIGGGLRLEFTRAEFVVKAV